MSSGPQGPTFQSNEPCTYAFCTFWGVGIEPKPPNGRHASVGTTQQSERLALNRIKEKPGLSDIPKPNLNSVFLLMAKRRFCYSVIRLVRLCSEL